jgi:tetratricopeptide (TPR) repeat protein
VKSEAERVSREMQSAATWLREDNYKQADRAFKDVVKHAHGDGLGMLEAEAHRTMAMYEPDYKNCVKHLQAAENALKEGHSISKSDQNAELASIMSLRVIRAAQEKQLDTAQVSAQTLKAMADDNRSQAVQLAWHVALGAVLVAQEKYVEAITHLQEDPESPMALQLLWQAYQQIGAHAEADRVAGRLSAFNAPTVEQALVVPGFRASLVSQAEQGER